MNLSPDLSAPPGVYLTPGCHSARSSSVNECAAFKTACTSPFANHYFLSLPPPPLSYEHPYCPYREPTASVPSIRVDDDFYLAMPHPGTVGPGLSRRASTATRFVVLLWSRPVPLGSDLCCLTGLSQRCSTTLLMGDQTHMITHSHTRALLSLPPTHSGN